MSERVITVRGLRLRSSPSLTESVILKIIPKHAVVSIKTQQVSGGITWGKTTYKGVIGWMSVSDRYSKAVLENKSPVGSKVESESFHWGYWPTKFIRYPNSRRLAINQKFGANPKSYQRFGLPGHEGIDFYAPHGTGLFAVAGGVVVRVGDERVAKHKGGHNYGVRIYIEHELGYQTVYAHLDRRLVDLGDTVEGGELIGWADNTGNSSGSHLHLTMKKKYATRRGETDWPYDIIDPTPFVTEFLMRNK